MKRFALYLGITTALVASCSIKEENFEVPHQDDVIFYASFEQPGDEGTKVYANENLLLRWNADDRVSIFNKLTYNQEYKFTGQTGADAGGFKRVDNDEFVTGSAISHVVSVYPYQETTAITESEVISITLPSEQLYAENTFGLGANTMVSVSEDNVLQYKNVGGYLMLKLYGEGVWVSSITLKGNNGEELAGKASVTMPLDGVPSVTMSSDATTEITLKCESPVQLGVTEEESTQFWFVVPPVSFSKGFTVSVNEVSGGVFEKSTSKSIVIERNKLSKMSQIEVENMVLTGNVIYYTCTDSRIVSPNNPNAFGANIVANEYIDGMGIMSFDGDVTSIGKGAFEGRTTLSSIMFPCTVKTITDAFVGCSNLSSVTMNDGLEEIGDFSFSSCIRLKDINIPDSVTRIGNNSFYYCSSLTSIVIPDSVTDIAAYAFHRCIGLINVTLPSTLTRIGDYVFSDCSSLESITIPESVKYIGINSFINCSSLKSIILPNYLKEIDHYSFHGCSSLVSVSLPESLTYLGDNAFSDCSSLISIRVDALSPPTGGESAFENTNNCPIYVPAESVSAYKKVWYWNHYADRIYAIGTPMAIDLGLSVKWASFNLGATKPEEYGDYYAWGETEPYYSSMDPLTWKVGKESGYSWASYKWCMGSENTMTKYCIYSDWGVFGYEGFTDGKILLDLEDDVAHVILGSNWRLPTDAEWAELMENCTWTWTQENGIPGVTLLSEKNANSLFMPASGLRRDDYISYVNFAAYYLSSSLDDILPDAAWYLHFEVRNGLADVKRTFLNRCWGYSVRPVYSE